jgi:hypothetical protein
VILEQASSLREAVPIVLHHHERFGGHGYPHGLRGQEIPLGARIVAIADAYEAMVNGRPYKAAITHHAALAELQRNAGTQFDPQLVEMFCALYAEGVPTFETDDPLAVLGGADHGHPHPHPYIVEPLEPLIPAQLPAPAPNGLTRRRTRQVAAG